MGPTILLSLNIWSLNAPFMEYCLIKDKLRELCIEFNFMYCVNSFKEGANYRHYNFSLAIASTIYWERIVCNSYTLFTLWGFFRHWRICTSWFTNLLSATHSSTSSHNLQKAAGHTAYVCKTIGENALFNTAQTHLSMCPGRNREREKAYYDQKKV